MGLMEVGLQERSDHFGYGWEEERAIYLAGIGYFNEHDFFEAHEAWEDIWAAATGKRAKFYQGLIQVAVTLEHMRRDNPRGVQAVWRSTLDKFEAAGLVVDGKVEGVYLGIDVGVFLAGVRLVIGDVLRMDTVPGQRPGDVVIDWDPGDLPRLELAYDPWQGGEAVDGG